MVTVETKHSLTAVELLSLKGFIGKNVLGVYSARVDKTDDPGHLINFANLVYLEFKNAPILSLESRYSESCFGDDFFDLSIKEPAILNSNIKKLRHQNLDSEFEISKIEIHGYSYSVESENSDPDPIWFIEKRNPGQPIKESIESEHILIFYSADNRRLIVIPNGFNIGISLNNETIDELLQEADLDGRSGIKLKREIL